MMPFILRQRWLCVSFACFALVFVLFVYDAHREQPMIRQLRAEGIPTSIEDLKAMYPLPPDSENGMRLLLEATEKLWEPDGDDYYNLPLMGNRDVEFGVPLTQEQQKTLRQYVDTNHETLELIFRAMDYPYIRLSHDRYLQEDFSPHRGVRRQARLLFCVALDAALNGDMELMNRAVTTGLRLGEPFLYGADRMDYFSASSYMAHSLHAIHLTMEYITPPRDIIQLWHHTLDRLSDVVIIGAQGVIRNESIHSVPAYRYRGLYFDSQEHEMSLFLKRNSMEWAQIPSFWAIRYYMRGATTALNAANDNVYSTYALSRDYNPFDYWFDVLFFTPTVVYGFQFRSVATDLARLTTAHTALAFLLFQYDHGRMPETLEELVPEYLETVPRDPFTPGAVIRYRVIDDVAVFYSIGRNEQDDGGVWDDDCRQCDDIIFRLKVPPVGI